MRALTNVVGEVWATLLMLVVIVALLALGGCSSSGRVRVGDVSPVGSTAVAFVEPGEFDQGERADVLEAVAEIQGAWLSDFPGAVLPAFTLQVIDAEEFDCGGVMAIGCTRSSGVVAVVRGGSDELPGLYHELCHRAGASRWGVDILHEDGRWSAWTRRGFEVAEKIAERRSWW